MTDYRYDIGFGWHEYVYNTAYGHQDFTSSVLVANIDECKEQLNWLLGYYEDLNYLRILKVDTRRKFNGFQAYMDNSEHVCDLNLAWHKHSGTVTGTDPELKQTLKDLYEQYHEAELTIE